MSILSGRFTQVLLFLLQAELKKKFHEEEAIKYVGFLEKAIESSGKDGFAVGSSVSPSFVNIRQKQHNDDKLRHFTLIMCLDNYKNPSCEGRLEKSVRGSPFGIRRLAE